MVEGVPASVQGSAMKRDAWKSKVRAAAKKSWTAEPVDVFIQVGITFFYLDKPPDVDNILKYTIDGLVGWVVSDDDRVTDVRGSLRSIVNKYELSGVDVSLAGPLINGSPFIQIKVAESPNLMELP
jgi:Holliday junction resolvase RusA-like endonuclease